MVGGFVIQCGKMEPDVMEIDCPAHAIAIWLEGDTITVRFPDRQLVTFETMGQVALTIRHRRDAALAHSRPTVGTRAAPVQYDIDKIAEAMKQSNGKSPEQIEERRIRERRRLLRVDAKRMALKEANALLSIAGL